MADESDYPKRGYDTKDVEAMREERPVKRRRRWGLIVLLSVVVMPAVLLGLWAWITLSYTYSSGDRVGYLQKFSKKGWLCKTWEGELNLANVPNATPDIFHFSVRDDRVAADLTRQMGNRITTTYEEHRGVPTSCFGDTDYFITDIRAVDAPLTPSPSPVASPPTTPPAPGTTPPVTPPAPPPPGS